MTPRATPTDLLLAVLGRSRAPVPDDLEPRQWDALVAAAARHGALPLLWHRLQERGAVALVPPAVRTRLAESHTLGALRAEAWSRQLRELLGALEARGVPVALLKGAFLAPHVYPSPAVRPMGDLDLLVPATRLEESMDAIADVGYARPSAGDWATFRDHRHPPPLTRPGRLSVELHVVIEPCAPPLALPLADVWARARPVPSHGPPALALAPEDLLLHLATHMGRSHLLGSSLLRVYDLAAWAERFGEVVDWDAVVRRSLQTGARRFVSTALVLAERVLDVPVPAEVRQALRHESDDVVVDDAVALLDATSVELSRALLLTRPGASAWDQLRRAGRALVVPPAGARRPGGAVADEGTLRRRRDAYRARWAAIARYLLNPSALRSAVRRIGQVRRLRSWAAGSG